MLAVDASPDGVEIRASAPLDRVALATEDGAPVAARTLPRPAIEVSLRAPLEAGAAYRLRASGASGAIEVAVIGPPREPVAIAVAAPLGQERRPATNGDVFPVVLADGSTVEVGVVLTAREPVEVDVVWPGGAQRVALGVPGAREVVRWSVDRPGPIPVTVVAGAQTRRFTLDVERASLDDVRAALPIDAWAFPTDRRGRVDRARPADRVDLPASWWTHLLVTTSWGWRPRDDQAPWAHQAVTLRNDGTRPVDLAVSAWVVGADGAPAPAFRSRVRGAPSPGGAVATLLRVPAGAEATAVLPVFVEASSAEVGRYTRVIEVTPLGSSEPVHRVEAPLVLRRGSAWASGGFVLSVVASLLGLLALAARGRAWLSGRDTAELMTIALFGSLTFVVAAASRLLGYGVATVLGPFAPLLTGLVDDAFRTCLLAALITLIPRPGVVTLASLVGWLLRGLALGSFHPADLLYLGSVVFFLEGGLWVVGLTRDPAWREQGRGARWLRLSLAFGVANALAVASGLVTTVVLYRLFLADWYVALMIGLHGFLYVVIGCFFAVGFADAVRRVAS